MVLPVLALLFAATSAQADGLQEGWAGRKQAVTLPNGVTLRYVEAGPADGHSLILLHGLTDTSRSWSMTLPLLERKYRVLIPDQRGHGASDAPACCYAVADFAGDLVALMDAKGIAKATLAGHSMGGFIAQYTAIAYPERVDRLVLVSTGASGVGNEALDWVLEQARAMAYPIDPGSKFIEEWTSNVNPVDPVFLQHVKPETARTPPQTWTGATLGLMVQDHRHLLPRVKVPTLILWGDQDPLLLVASQELLREVLPGAERKTYEKAGHNLPWEHPERVAQDIIGFAP
jgi:pimeloyl-ACP methyl ester carboxylesterase